MMPPVFGTFSLPAHRYRISSRSSGCRMIGVNSRQPREYPQLDVGWSARSLIVPSLLVQVVRCRGRINPMTDKGWSVLMPVQVLAEARVAGGALAGRGALVVPDEPRAGLDAALRHGAGHAAARWPGDGTAALSADLPALGPEQIGRARRAAAAWPTAFVAGPEGDGTTLYTATP